VKDCAVGLMTNFVAGEDIGIDWSVDLGLLVKVQRGVGTRERVPFSGGLDGVEFLSEDEEMELELEVRPSRTVVAPELPMLKVASPSPRKGMKDVKRKGGRRRRGRGGFIDD
jgi:hypothetical protein